jgi:hypothetical protein
LATLYTVRIGAGLFTDSEPFECGSPPSGYIWDVRDINVVAPGDGVTGLQGFTVSIALGAGPTPTLWAVVPALSGTSYHWTGRAVVTEYDTLTLFTPDAVDYQCVVTGYRLTLP